MEGIGRKRSKVYLKDGGLGPELRGRGVGLCVGGGPTAGHVHADGKLLQDPHHFLMGLANQGDAVDLRQQAQIRWDSATRSASLAAERNPRPLTSSSSSPLNSFPQRPTGPSGRTERM